MPQKIILDVIPIEIDEMYPTEAGIWHFENDGLKNGVDKETIINYMKEEIKEKFYDCKVIIIIEKGRVIDVL